MLTDFKNEPNIKVTNLCIHSYHPALHKEDSKHGQMNGTLKQDIQKWKWSSTVDYGYIKRVARHITIIMKIERTEASYPEMN